MSNKLYDENDLFSDSNGDPLSGGSLVFSLTGTDTAEAVYSDAGLSVSLGSTVTLDAGGRPASGGSPVGIYGTANYRVKIKNAAGSTLFTVENKQAQSTFAGITMTDQLLLDDSTSLTTPVIAFSNDTNTGFSHPTADTVVGVAGGAEVFRFDSNGLGNGSDVLPISCDVAIGATSIGTTNADNVLRIGNVYIASKQNLSVAESGTVDISVGSSFQGLLVVSNVLNGNAEIRTQTTYSALGRVTASEFTSLGTDTGSTAAAPFSLSVPSSGTIRVTNNYAGSTKVTIQFLGGVAA